MKGIMVSEPFHLYKNHNITISGLPGCGSTTLLNLLREELKFDGWKGFSGGEFMRAYAAEKGMFDDSKALHHDASHYEDDFDRKIDMGMREKLQKEKFWILESWLSGFVAQQVPSVLKVLVICSDDAVRIDRIMNRDNVPVDVAKKNISERYNNNVTKWRRMYAANWKEWIVDTGVLPADTEIDFWRPELYDLVIDTFRYSKSQSLELVLNAIKK